MFTTMSSSDKTDWIEVVTAVQRRRRWTPDEKLALVQQTLSPANLFLWLHARRAFQPANCSSGAKHTPRA